MDQENPGASGAAIAPSQDAEQAGGGGTTALHDGSGAGGRGGANRPADQAAVARELGASAVRKALADEATPGGFRITKFGRHAEEGYFHARVSAEGQTVYVHRRYGSWMAPGTNARGQEVMKEIVLPVKEALQEKARAIEKHERLTAKEAEDAADDNQDVDNTPRTDGD